MKILMSAYACEPGKGSEPAVGWNWAKQAARVHEVWVLTRANNRAAIDAELAARPVPNLHFIYHDLPRWVSRWKHAPGGLHAYYLLWQLSALPLARRSHRRLGFDIGHHVTFVSLRYPTFLSVLGIPFIWGPVGGGERAPRRFYSIYGRHGAAMEAVREISAALARFDPFVWLTARRAKVVLATTSMSAAAVPTPARRKLTVMPAIGIDERACPSRANLGPSNTLRLIYVGNLLYWKGLRLGLAAMARACDAGTALTLTVIGDGPYRGELARRAERLGIADRVCFLGQMPRDEVLERYNAHDAMLFPSVHDSGGFVVLEAMMAGLPVVCLDLGGPALSVTDTTGIRIPAHAPAQVVSDLADALQTLARSPELRRQMGIAGRQRVHDVYAWDRKGEVMDKLYELVGQAARPEGAPSCA